TGDLKSFKENPFIGTGPNVFTYHHFQDMKGTRFRQNFKKTKLGIYDTHNIFLQILVESGLIGFSIFFSILVLLFRLFRKRKYYIALPFLTLFIGQLFDCFLDDYFFNVFFVSLLAIAIYENRKADEISEGGQLKEIIAPADS
ncbi:MAG: O-antigen ligase family protein, partial [archaeon]|nr:O-antigen ligase family protein [archaeon]